MRILSRNQLAMSNFSREGYEFNEIEGTFKGTMRFAVWGSKCNAIAYVELDGGRKIMCTAFQQPNDALARCLLPDLMAFYETEDGQREFEQWKKDLEDKENE